MHVFIDTNVLLNFYHFTNDDLDALNSVFVSHEKGTITVHLTDQVRDEFWRNREGKILDALKKFRNFNLSAQFPYFMKSYDEFITLQELTKTFKTKYTEITAKAESDIKTNNLRADHLITGIFEKATFLSTDKDVYEQAKMRMEIGNPPGKNGSIGDAINWILLLHNVPSGENMYLITEDSDFYSSIDESEINPFLLSEWKAAKNSAVRGYRSLRDFIKDHFDGIQISLDPAKKALLDALEASGSFKTTHALIAQINKYKYFSLEEAKAILDASDSNPQFGMIIEDPDVLEFLQMAVLPHKDKLVKEGYKETIDAILAAAEE